MQESQVQLSYKKPGKTSFIPYHNLAISNIKDNI